MRLESARLLSTTAVLMLGVAVSSCTPDNDPLQPPMRALFTTPTGLVTANPPEIFVGAGDMGTCNSNNDEATAKLLDNIPGTVFALGDNVYENGTNSEFNNCYHPTWGRHKARTKPSAGNHDYNTSGAAGYYNYFGAAAGDPTKGYYSFALGAWHVIVLNSNISMSATSAQTKWLVADLAAHTNLCTVAYWHHPLYSSSGGSGSGGVTYSSVRPLVDALYAGGADLILGGHRHFYDRLAPIKPNGTRDDAFGVRHIVAGMGGKSGGSVSNVFPASEARNGDTFGVLKLYLYEDSYAWKFIPVAGKTYTDSGSTACHGVPGAPPPPTGGVSASQSTVSASPATITAGSGVATITVTAKDASGNPVSGATVVLAAGGSLNTLTQPSGPTGADGVATGTLSSNVAQDKIVSARINGVAITQTDTVTVVPDAASALAFTVQPSNAPPGGTIAPAVEITINDQFGNRVASAADNVTLAIGTNSGGGTLSGTTTVAAQAGVATFGDLSIDRPGNGYTLVASATGLGGATSTAFDIAAGSVSAITHTLLTVGTNPANQRVYTTGAIAPAPNALITIAVLGQNSSSAPPIPTLSGGGMTSWEVVATTTFDAGTSPKRRVTIFRALSAAPGSGPVTITSSMTLSHAQWIVSQWGGVETSGANGAGAIGQTGSTSGGAVSGLTVPLAAFGNASNAAYGVFAVNAGTAVVSPGSGFTEIAEQPSGEGTPGDLQAEWATNDPTIDATWSAGLNAGALGVEIKAGGSGPGPGPGPGGVDPSRSTVSAAPISITAGSEASTITVTVKDGSGNPISGAVVQLAATGSGNTLTQPTEPTDAGGVALGTLSSTVAQGKTVSATANGTQLAETAPVTVTAAAASSIALNAGDGQTAPAGSAVPVAPSVRVADQFGNTVAGVSVTFAVASGGGAVNPTSAVTTGANGIAAVTSWTLGPTAGTNTLTATSNGLTGSPVTFTATGTATTPAQDITHALLTAGVNIVNQKVYPTPAIAPAPNTLITVAVLGQSSLGIPPIPTLSGGGMAAWDVVASVTFDTGTLPTRRLTIFRAMSATPGSGPITITSTMTLSHAQWIVSQWDGVDQSGANGAGAIGQTGSASGEAVTGLTVPLAAFASSKNVGYGAFGVRSQVVAVTPGAGFTEISEVPSGESTPGDLQAEWAANLNAIRATWANLNGGALGVEIRARTTAP